MPGGVRAIFRLLKAAPVASAASGLFAPFQIGSQRLGEALLFRGLGVFAHHKGPGGPASPP